MTKYIIKRLLLSVLVLLGVSLILYILIRCMPVNYIIDKFSTQMSQGNMKAEDLERIMKSYGFDLILKVEVVAGKDKIVDYWVDNSFGNILGGYFLWLGNLFKGDLGTSFKYNLPVGEVIAKNMGISFGISFVSLIFEVIIAIPLGIKCACNQYGKFDYITTFLFMTLMAFPSFFLGNMFIKWFAVDLGWFPTGGLSDLTNVDFFTLLGDNLYHLILPMLVITILNIGSLLRYTRTNTLEVLNADYIRTARAKGLSEGKVVYKHVFRNTLIPLVTVLAATLPMLFGGAMITEEIFAIDGIGRITYQALKEGDIPLTMGYNMFIAILTVLGTLLADLMYAVVDPRVKLA